MLIHYAHCNIGAVLRQGQVSHVGAEPQVALLSRTSSLHRPSIRDLCEHIAPARRDLVASNTASLLQRYASADSSDSTTPLTTELKMLPKSALLQLVLSLTSAGAQVPSGFTTGEVDPSCSHGVFGSLTAARALRWTAVDTMGDLRGKFDNSLDGLGGCANNADATWFRDDSNNHAALCIYGSKSCCMGSLGTLTASKGGESGQTPQNIYHWQNCSA